MDRGIHLSIPCAGSWKKSFLVSFKVLMQHNELFAYLGDSVFHYTRNGDLIGCMIDPSLRWRIYSVRSSGVGMAHILFIFVTVRVTLYMRI